MGWPIHCVQSLKEEYGISSVNRDLCSFSYSNPPFVIHVSWLGMKCTSGFSVWSLSRLFFLAEPVVDNRHCIFFRSSSWISVSFSSNQSLFFLVEKPTISVLFLDCDSQCHQTPVVSSILHCYRTFLPSWAKQTYSEAQYVQTNLKWTQWNQQCDQ